MSTKIAAKKLRFAALIRVSTETQEQLGESLKTQRTGIEGDVQLLNGSVVAWYGGQEHATPGHERKELDRLLADADKGRFDAVIVANADRWSRDNAKSEQGLSVLKKAGVRFFVGVSEYDLYNPEHRLFLGLSSVIGQFQAHHHSKKSVLNRIHRARTEGKPTGGKLPYGRTYNDANGWSVDPDKVTTIQNVARRYLAGDGLFELAAEYGFNHANLWKILKHRCGPDWSIRFDSDELGIHEVVEIEVPPLLPDEVIRRVHDRMEANKTYTHGQAKNSYLLGRMLFCAECGYALFGQTNRHHKRYYRHVRHYEAKSCPFPQVWVAADEIESAVLRSLFGLFGNPAAVQRAIEDAIPNREQAAELAERRSRLTAELDKLAEGRSRLLRLVAKGTVQEEDAERELAALAPSEAVLKAELERLQDTLASVPSAETVEDAAGRIVAAVRKIDRLNHDPEGMTWEERRALTQAVFGGKAPAGHRLGVYIRWTDGQRYSRRKKWIFTLDGQFVSSLLTEDLIDTMLDAGAAARDVARAFMIDGGRRLPSSSPRQSPPS